MNRRKVKNASSKNEFIKYAMKTQAKNIEVKLSRGGFRM